MDFRSMLSRSIGLLSLLTGLCGAPAFAACTFSEGKAGYGANGDTPALIANGFVTVNSASHYITPYSIEVGLWVDDDAAKLATNMPDLVLSYFEHANCIFGKGGGNDGVHDLSLHIAGNRIHYFKPTIAKISGKNAYWVQQTHQDWRKAIQALGSDAPKVNLLFSASNYVEVGTLGADGKVATWTGIGGASNGVGQGQALARVDPNAFDNGGGKAFNRDWWGVIAAHEMGHALGFGNHLAVKFDTMCCKDPVAYGAEPGNTDSEKFYLSQTPWQAAVVNNSAAGDNYADPYAQTPNPLTNEKWSFTQIHGFLVPYNFQEANLWRFTGKACTASACPGWEALDNNPKTVAIAASEFGLYQLHSDGLIWGYTGKPCSGITCTGWNKLDNNANSVAIAAGNTLYQRHKDGSIWAHTGTPCSGGSCTGWKKLDNNSKTVEIAAAGSHLYQRHSDGTVWSYTGTACSGTSCPGWKKLDNNTQTAQIVGAADKLYQRHSDGSIWVYTGTPCSGSSCPGWKKLDNNAKTKTIAAAGNDLYQLHGDGLIWHYTGTPCSGSSCPGWKKLDNNAKTVAISAGAGTLFQLHKDGAIWRYTGTPCTANGCNGWQMIDNNYKGIAIESAGLALYQRHSN